MDPTPPFFFNAVVKKKDDQTERTGKEESYETVTRRQREHEQIYLKMVEYSKAHPNDTKFSRDLAQFRENMNVAAAGIQVAMLRMQYEGINSTYNGRNTLEDGYFKFLKGWIPKTRLGEGSFGEVIEAEHAIHGRCAIKKINFHNNADHMENFVREVDILARCTHPGIVRLFDSWLDQPECNKNELLYGSFRPSVGRDKLDLYLAIELCQKGNLSTWLSQNTRSEDRSIVKMKNWLGQLCSSMEYLHGKGFMHRDLKTLNIMFALDGTLKIGDFGLVQINRSRQEINGATGPCEYSAGIGTRIYWSPELLSARTDRTPYDQKVDVFALGIIYCEMLIPECEDRVLEQLQNGSKPLVDPTLGEDEKRIIYWMTAFDSANRATCRELLDSDYLKNIDPPTKVLFS